ncbi:hypothetical protein AB1Y20_008222 [Prymnesium parvum]
MAKRVRELQAEAELDLGEPLAKKRGECFRRVAREALVDARNKGVDDVTYDMVLIAADAELQSCREDERKKKKQRVAAETEGGDDLDADPPEQGEGGEPSGDHSAPCGAEDTEEDSPRVGECDEAPGPSASVQSPMAGGEDATRPPSPASQTAVSAEVAEAQGEVAAEPQYWTRPPPEMWFDQSARGKNNAHGEKKTGWNQSRCYVCGGIDRHWKYNRFRHCDKGDCKRAVHILSCGGYKQDFEFKYYCPPCARALSAPCKGVRAGYYFVKKEQELRCTDEEYRKRMALWNENGATAALVRGPKELRLPMVKSAETCLPDAVYIGLGVLGVAVDLKHLRKYTVVDFGGKKASNTQAVLDYLSEHVPAVVYQDVSAEMTVKGGPWVNILKTEGRVFVHHIEMEFKGSRFRHCVMVSTVKEEAFPFGKILDNMKFSTPVKLEEKDCASKGAAHAAFKLLFDELVVDRIAPRNTWELVRI